MRFVPAGHPGDAVVEAWANPFFNFIAQKIAHDLVLPCALGAFGVATKRARVIAFAFGWTIHVWVDSGMHVLDAYPVLWPFSLRVFPAPVSYWDPQHHGRVLGVALSLMTIALWAWIGIRWWKGRDLPPGVARRRWARIAMCAVAALAVIASTQAIRFALRWTVPPAPRWVDDGLWERGWPPDLEPVVARLDAGDGATAIAMLGAIESADPQPEAMRMHAEEEARRRLLAGFALDLLGRRQEAVTAYRAAERLEPEGTVGDKARRYEGEPWRNAPDPPVSAGWAAIFAAGAAATIFLFGFIPDGARPLPNAKGAAENGGNGRDGLPRPSG